MAETRPLLSRLPVALGVVIVVMAAVADFTVRSDVVNPSIAYAIAIVGLAWSRSRTVVWGAATIVIALTYAALVLGPGPPTLDHLWADRTVVAASIVAIAALVDRWIRAEEALLANRAEIEARSADVEAANAELSAREEEIVRQNEELQSQSEELERQSEELRITNDDLASRERMLAQLLELSRNLGGKLAGNEVMGTLCEALIDLGEDGIAGAAVLLIEGDDIHVRCHEGFGPGGAARERFPFKGSFAALVVERAQAGYLPDLALRPELHGARPAAGPPFRSVLGAPIWVRGRAIGTLEVYTLEPHEWTDEHVTLITSMAAQASISLDTARLFEEVERERRRFEAVFRTLPVGVLVCDDPACRHVTGNPAAAALLNAPVDANFSPLAAADTLVRRTLFENGEQVAPEGTPIVRAVLRGEETQAREFELVLPSARRIVVLASAVPIYDAAGHVRGGVCVFADITAQKRLARELETRRREAEEASLHKSRFLAAVSHDIRTPANAIRLRAELIKRTSSNPALAGKIPELAEELQASAVSLVDLVGEVLDLTRFDSGKIELHESEFSLGDAILEECRQLTPAADARGLRLVCEPVEPPLWLRADRIKVARVVSNLLENAIKFTGSGGVTLRATLGHDRRMELRVIDTGPGIPREHVHRIFDEFFQLRNPERDRAKGRGLGLAICRRLVDAMGGELTVESTSPAGTTFLFALPPTSVVALPETTGSAERQEPMAHALDGLHVLVVEDDASTRHDIAALLRAEGAAVTEVGEGSTALRMVRGSTHEVLLLDLMLPDLDGAEVLRALREDRPPALRAVFVLTGDSASRRPEELARLGADAIITKPIDPDALLARLRSVLAGRT